MKIRITNYLYIQIRHTIRNVFINTDIHCLHTQPQIHYTHIPYTHTPHNIYIYEYKGVNTLLNVYTYKQTNRVPHIAL